MRCSRRIVTEQDRRALAAGLPAEVLLVLIQARRLWHQSNGGDPGRPDPNSLTWELPPGGWLTPEVAEAIRHPAAPAWDGVFITAMRRLT